MRGRATPGARAGSASGHVRRLQALGRRNRHRNGDAAPGGNGDTAHAVGDREPDAAPQDFTPPGGLIAPAPTEPDLKEAVADLDAPPRPAAPAAMRAEPSEQFHPAEEPVRRRSTVRERAPIGAPEETPPPQAQQPVSPTPEPVITEIGEAAEADRPRRTGWWSRRFAGG